LEVRIADIELRKMRPGLSQPNADKVSLTLVLLICLVGWGIRFGYPSRVAVEHFDEGVYASNIWFGSDSGYQYQLRQLYAPPLLPGLIEMCSVAEMLLLRTAHAPSDITVMIPSLVAGCLTVLLTWWVVRGWFGVRAGFAASMLVATSDVHALYSRAALTDALLVLFILAALWLTERACTTGRPQTIVLAGVTSGLAWWTKYNGWLALFISFCGICCWGFGHRRRAAEVLRHLGRWLVIALIAMAVWLPVLGSLQSIGGYAAVAANHKNYVVGLAGWWTSFVRQANNLSHFDGVLGCAGVAIAVILIGAIRDRDPSRNAASGVVLRRPRLEHFALAAILCGSACLLGVSVTLLALSVCGLAAYCRNERNRENAEQHRYPLAFWFLAIWLVSLFLATPLYHPYPRLVLPWLCAAWIAGGLGAIAVTRWVEHAFAAKPDAGAGGRWRKGVAITGLAVFIVMGAWSLPRIAELPVAAWQPRVGLRKLAPDMVRQARNQAQAAGFRPDEVLLYVYGEPALFFHCRRYGLPLVAPVADPQAALAASREIGRPTLLATGPHAHHSPEFQKQWKLTRGQFKLLARYDYKPSDLVLLNRYPPHEVRQRPPITEEVRLYVVR
jgi:4-amino-4-deoxy-L-arabinose transferase-like glycosyltransferase